MCDCRNDIEAKLLERFRKQASDAKNHEASLRGYVFVITDRVYQIGAMPIELTAEHPLKKGGYKRKTEKMSMHFSYCPFCGAKYEKGSA